MNEEQIAFEDAVWCQTCDKHASMAWYIVMNAMTYDAAMARHLDSHVKVLKQKGAFAYAA